MKEMAVRFGKFNSLIGVITEPDPPELGENPAIILSNAGLIHHIGPNRIYVKLARHLAENGYRVIRFDLSGVGGLPDRTIPPEQFCG
jgi:alpha-beta hydrolase superfamily lysophospholipase